MRRRYHLGLSFLAYCSLTLLVALAAMNTGANLLFWVFGVMASALLISGAVSGVMMINLRVRRIVPAHGAVGEPLVVRYAVRNRGRVFPAFNVHFQERPTSAHHERGRPAWQRLMAPSRAWVMHIGPRETVHGEAVFRPQRRGEAWFDRLQIRTTFPFGIVGKSIAFTQPQRVLVYPRQYVLRQRVLDALSPVGTVGMRITQHAGAGDDYFGLREFRPGDSMRHIAWKRTANRDQLVCIERTRPSPPKLRLVLNLTPGDEAAGEERGDDEEKAISLAASILFAADAAGYEIGLTVLGLGRPPLPIRRNHWHRHRIMAALARIDLDAPRYAITEHVPPDSGRVGLVVVHPGLPDPTVVRGEAWHLSVGQLEHLVDPRGGAPRSSGDTPPARETATPRDEAAA